MIGALLGIIATSINYSIRQRDLSNLTKSLERQVDQGKEINFYTLELKKIVDELETRLGETAPDHRTETNDRVLNELRSINQHLSSLDDHRSAGGGQLVKSTDAHKLNILLAGLTLLSITVFYDLFINRIH